MNLILGSIQARYRHDAAVGRDDENIQDRARPVDKERKNGQIPVGDFDLHFLGTSVSATLLFLGSLFGSYQSLQYSSGAGAGMRSEPFHSMKYLLPQVMLPLKYSQEAQDEPPFGTRIPGL